MEHSRNKDGSGLNLAILNDQFAVVETLLKHPKTENLIPNEDLGLGFRNACCHGRTNIFKFFISLPNSVEFVNMKDEDRFTSFMLACQGPVRQ